MAAAAAEAMAVGMFPIRIAMLHLPREARNKEEIGLEGRKEGGRKEGEWKGESSSLAFSLRFFADINKYGESKQMETDRARAWKEKWERKTTGKWGPSGLSRIETT